jgi:hypothetical protein
MKNTEDYYKIDINKEYIQKLINHSLTPNIKQYIDMIFKSATNEPSIYQMSKNELQMFRQLKQKMGKKEKLKLTL